MPTKLFCSRRSCRRFIGFIGDDGSGPFLDECDHNGCPMIQATSKWEPAKAKGYDIGKNTGPIDEDAGSYQSVARRALEDQ